MSIIAGRVSTVSNPANQTRFAEVASYAEHGAIQTLKLGGLLTGAEAANEVWTYNNRLQPIETRLRTGGSALNLSRLEYFYCPAQLPSCTSNNGNLRSQRISNEAVGSEPSWTTLQQYGYDPLNRLTTFNDGTATETNNYDPWGNRWATVSGLTPSPLTPADASWFSPGNNRLSNLGYDEVGNQTQVNPYTLIYDGEGHVTSVTSASNGSAAYAYDADGRRVTKTIGTNVTAFVYDAFGQLAAEYGPSTGTAGLQFQMADHLGSTRVVTDADGAVIRRHDYRPFGEDLTGVSGRSSKYGDTLNVLRFTGQLRDAETSLDFFGARYLSAAQGRFTSPDSPLADQSPSDPQSWNLYGYVRNNPLRNTDPTGGTCVPNGSGGYKDIAGPGGTCSDAYQGDIANPGLTVTAQSPPTPLLMAVAAGTRRAEGPVIIAAVGTALVVTGGAAGTIGTAGGSVLNLAAVNSGGAASAAVYQLLKDSYRSMELVGEAIQGISERLIAAGHGIREVARLVNQYGGKASDWRKLSTRGVDPSKIQSYAQQAGKGAPIEIHYYKNVVTGVIVEMKSVFTDVR